MTDNPSNLGNYVTADTTTREHERWLRCQRFDDPALKLSYEAAFDAMLACLDRRSRLDDAITPIVHRLGCI